MPPTYSAAFGFAASIAERTSSVIRTGTPDCISMSSSVLPAFAAPSASHRCARLTCSGV